jgi:hypothetical protein
MNKTEQPIEQSWQTAMRTLIAKLKQADNSFTASEHDNYGMRNFIQNTRNPEWRNVIEQSPDEVKTILDSIQTESIAA